MAATLLKASEINEIGLGEGFTLAEGSCAIPAALKTSAISATEGNNIETGSKDLGRCLLLVEGTAAAATKHAKIQAGGNPPALRAKIGELDVTMAEKVLSVFYLEGARHESTAGLIEIKWTSGTTGKIAVLYLKKGN